MSDTTKSTASQTETQSKTVAEIASPPDFVYMNNWTGDLISLKRHVDGLVIFRAHLASQDLPGIAVNIVGEFEVNRDEFEWLIEDGIEVTKYEIDYGFGKVPDHGLTVGTKDRLTRAIEKWMESWGVDFLDQFDKTQEVEA